MARRIEVPLETLAKQRPPETNLSREDLDAIAHLAMMLQTRLPLSTPYTSLTEDQRVALRNVVLSVVWSMHMLGWIEAPS